MIPVLPQDGFATVLPLPSRLCTSNGNGIAALAEPDIMVQPLATSSMIRPIANGPRRTRRLPRGRSRCLRTELMLAAGFTCVPSRDSLTERPTVMPTTTAPRPAQDTCCAGAVCSSGRDDDGCGHD